MRFDPDNLIDKSPQYWEARENKQFAHQLDSFYVQRARGQVQPQFRQYALPKSQMLELRANTQGGLPVFRGMQNSALPTNYSTSKVTPMTEEARQSMQYLNGGVMGMPQNAPNPAYAASSVDREVGPQDVQQIMMQRMMSQGASPAQMVQGGIVNMPAQGAGGPRIATLIEGHTFYRPLQVSGFPTSMPIVRTGGTIQGARGPVEIKEIARVYNADGLQRIDAGAVQQDVQRHMQLVVIQAPWTNGPVLVPREAIVENGYGGGGNQQLLVDSRMRQQPQPQMSMEQRMMMHHQQQQLNADQQLLLQQPQRQQPMPQHQPQRQISQIDQSARDLLKRRGLLKG